MKNPFIIVSLPVFILALNGFASLSPVKLLPADLYNAFKADHLKLSANNDAVVLDLRNVDKSFTGRMETDILDPFDPANNTVAAPCVPVKMIIEAEAKTPKGTQLRLFYKTGNFFFSEAEWGDWTEVKLPKAEIPSPKDRYLRLRCDFLTENKDVSPSLSKITVSLSCKDSIGGMKSIRVISFQNEKIIASPYPFDWERPDNPLIQQFMKDSKYAGAFAKGTTELDKFYALNKAVAMTPNDRQTMFKSDYPWDVRKLCPVVNGKFSIEGHCMSYAAVLVTAFTGVHQYARHWAVNGFRDTDHEVVEVWSNSLKKWVYLDPSLSQYYLDPKTKQPNSILENHNTLVNFILKDGEDLRLSMDEQRARVKAQGGGQKAPILCVDSGWHYGAAAPKDYDWGWLHGYMADGFLRLTPRNNFHSQKEPWFTHFGDGQDFNVFVSWTDAKTPLYSANVKNYSGRVRDFWYTLNQASIKAVRKGEKTIAVEFGNSQPFFKKYLVAINGGAPVELAASYTWELKQGENMISVLPVDEWGEKGIGSTLKVAY